MKLFNQMYGIFRYYFRFFIYYVILSINSILLIPFHILHPKDVKNLLLTAMVCQPVSWMIGVKYLIKGRKHLETNEACIIVANHQSSLDMLGMFHLWPLIRKCSPIIKKEILYIWPMGLSAWLGGSIFIDRSNTNKSIHTLNNAVQDIKKKKIKLWIFPEGTRRSTGEIHGFKKGAFYAAVNGQLPILPIVFSSYYFMSKTEKRFDSGKVIIVALPMISTQGLQTEDVSKLIEKTRTLMIREFNSINKKLKFVS